jgi:hypothetical protein
MAIFVVSFLPQLAAGKSAARDDRGKGCGYLESGGWAQGDEKRLRPETTFHRKVALPLVIPSAAERLQFRGPLMEMFFDRA